MTNNLFLRICYRYTRRRVHNLFYFSFKVYIYKQETGCEKLINTGIQYHIVMLSIIVHLVRQENT